MQIRTLLFGTALTTGAILFSLRQVPDPLIPIQVHHQPLMIHRMVTQKITVHRAIKLTRRPAPVPQPAKIVKQKVKRKPYFLARAGNA